MESFDLVIIGGGPVGLFSAFYAGRRNMKTSIIEASGELGGQPCNLYPEKEILDVPGLKKISGLEFTKRLIEQAESDHLTIIDQTKVENYEGDLAQGFKLRCDGSRGKEEILARSILITTGMGEITPRFLEVGGEERLKDKGVYYYLKTKELVSGKKVVVVGGGDSALDWLDLIDDVASEVHLVHRRDEFRAQEESIKKLKKSKAKLHLNAHITQIYGEEQVTGVQVLNTAGEKEEITCDVVLVAIGFHINLGSIGKWPLEMEKGSIVVKSDMETSVPGIFAAGDVAYTPGVGSSKLIVIGFGQGAIAVNTAKTRIDPAAAFFPGHSTGWKL
jgi:thioredoxin reductase